jgi:RND family efflux transporter MFP subunit
MHAPSRPILICSAVALCALSVLSLRLAFSDEEPSEGANADNATVFVQQTALRKGTLLQTTSAYGIVQADASVRRTVMAPLAARVGAIYVHLGQEVASGAPLLQLVPTPPTASTYAQAVSALKVASDALTRTQQLLDEHLATRQQLADAQKAESDARAALAALKTQGAAGPTALRAPFHAIVTALSVSTNALVTEGSALLELSPPSNLVLQAGVAPALAASIRRGNAAQVTPVGGRQSFAGRVTMRGAIVDPSSGLVPVQISLPPGGFFPGQTAEAAITVGSVDGYVVPHAAILVDDNGDSYVVQTQKMVAKKVPVQVLGAHDDENVIQGSLDASAPVVIAGNHQLQDGMKVRLTQEADSDKGAEANKSEPKSDKGEKPASKPEDSDAH